MLLGRRAGGFASACLRLPPAAGRRYAAGPQAAARPARKAAAAAVLGTAAAGIVVSSDAKAADHAEPVETAVGQPHLNRASFLHQLL